MTAPFTVMRCLQINLLSIIIFTKVSIKIHDSIDIQKPHFSPTNADQLVDINISYEVVRKITLNDWLLNYDKYLFGL